MTLPPGQRLVDELPRFGANPSQPPPAVPVDPVITIGGAVTAPFDVPLSTLAGLARREITADFHCVAGWSATNLRWEGVPFETVFRTLIEPALRPEAPVTQLEFRGLDGWRSVVLIDDVLADDVLIADRLDGRPLDRNHGAPARLVSPRQYGYVSTKHLCRIDVHTAEPKLTRGSLLKGLPLRLIRTHPRARVWEEERHRYLPAWSVRRVYRATIAPVAYLSAKSTRQTAACHGRMDLPLAARLTTQRTRTGMRLPRAAHESRPWRIRDIAPDFRVEDVWALPVEGGGADLLTLVEVIFSLDLAESGSVPTRFLWQVRDRLGGWLGLGRVSVPTEDGGDKAAGRVPAAGVDESSLVHRLPDDLRHRAADLHLDFAPFQPLYRTETEFAAELSNRTVHAVMHLAWVDQGDGRYRGQMAVYVKPRGRFGKGYMAFIKPFRYWVVYPTFLRLVERAWRTRVPGPDATT